MDDLRVFYVSPTLTSASLGLTAVAFASVTWRMAAGGGGGGGGGRGGCGGGSSVGRWRCVWLHAFQLDGHPSAVVCGGAVVELWWSCGGAVAVVSGGDVSSA